MVASARKWMGVTLLATLVIGIGAGVLIDRFVLASTAHSRDVERRGDGDHREHGRRMVERLRSRLDLTEDQATRLEDVMNKNHDTAREFWQNSRKEYEALRKQFRADIREILTEDQRVTFDAMAAEYDARRESREGRRGGN